jgi:hypothetical protein
MGASAAHREVAWNPNRRAADLGESIVEEHRLLMVYLGSQDQGVKEYARDCLDLQAEESRRLGYQDLPED